MLLTFASDLLAAEFGKDGIYPFLIFRRMIGEVGDRLFYCFIQDLRRQRFVSENGRYRSLQIGPVLFDSCAHRQCDRKGAG